MPQFSFRADEKCKQMINNVVSYLRKSDFWCTRDVLGLNAMMEEKILQLNDENYKNVPVSLIANLTRSLTYNNKTSPSKTNTEDTHKFVRVTVNIIRG